MITGVNMILPLGTSADSILDDLGLLDGADLFEEGH